jgi:hypothetical protein
MSSHKSRGLKQSLDGRLWQPLFLADHAARLKSGSPEKVQDVLAWIEKCGEDLQSDLDSVHTFFPDVEPFDVAVLKSRIEFAADNAAELARIGDKLLDLDASIKTTDSRIEEYIPDDLFFGGASIEEIADHALKTLAKKRRKSTKQAS